MKIRNIFFVEIINNFLYDFKLLVKNFLFEGTGRDGLDCGDDGFVFLTDQGLHLLELEDYLGQVPGVPLYVPVVLVPVCFEPLLDA